LAKPTTKDSAIIYY